MKARIVMIIMAVALIALPTIAQQQEWQSTSAMRTSGSVYSSQVTPVGASSAASVATTTTETYSPAKISGPRKDFGKPGEEYQSDESPIGDAVLPLMLMAVAYVGYTAIKRRKERMFKV